MTEIKPQITTGNLLQIGVMLAAIVAAFIAVQGSVSAHEAKLLDHESRLRVIEKEIAVELSKINTKLGSIAKAVNE
jgi:hypothetical protein